MNYLLSAVAVMIASSALALAAPVAPHGVHAGHQSAPLIDAQGAST